MIINLSAVAWHRFLPLYCIFMMSTLTSCVFNNNSTPSKEVQAQSTTTIIKPIITALHEESHKQSDSAQPIVSVIEEISSTLLITAPRILIHSWSPDGNILAYWTFTQDEVQKDFMLPPGKLHFFNVVTRQQCTYPYQVSYFGNAITWLAMGQVVTVTDQRQTGSSQVLLSTPCKEDFKDITNLFPAEVFSIATTIPDQSSILFATKAGYWLYYTSEQTIKQLNLPQTTGLTGYSWSPNGEYLTSTAFEYVGESISAKTYVTNLITGQVEETIPWQVRPAEGDLAGPGPTWLGNKTFLIQETLDQGPLLVTLGGSIKQVTSFLFHLETEPGLRAEVAPVTGIDTYHIILFSRLDLDTFPVRIYHAETESNEELPFHDTLGFSPDGKWLLGFTPGEQGVWLWPVDSASNQGVKLPLAQDSFTNQWKPDSTQIITGGYGEVTIFAVPQIKPLRSWQIGNYKAEPFGWSTNGKRIAVRGIGAGHEALLIWVGQ